MSFENLKRGGGRRVKKKADFATSLNQRRKAFDIKIGHILFWNHK